MIEKKHIQTTMWIMVIIWAFLLLTSGFEISLSFFKPVSTAIGITLILLELLEKWAWKLQWLHPWFISTPDVSGTWQGQIISKYVDPITGQQIAPIEAYFIIHQTLTSIQIKLVTAESSSNTIGATLSQIDGTFRIMGVYLNIPKQAHRERSAIHHGGLSLEICVNTTTNLDGFYWTDRKTQGDLVFKNRKKTICSNFADCKNCFTIN